MQVVNLNKSINEVLNYDYVIPLYQRNYAWGENEIHQLLQDVYSAFKKDKNSNYFIGSLVVLKRRDGAFEVIDGQQRLTTISLISKKLYSDDDKYLKLQYDSRPEVEGFLNYYYQNGTVLNTSKSHLTSHFEDALVHINSANLDIIKEQPTLLGNIKNNNPDAYKEFSNYFFNNVIILKVEIPDDTDVAHYFEVMNNRGEQLEKHEILKARLLNKIKDKPTESYLFSKIWDACSQMDIPVHRFFTPKDREKLFGTDYNSFKFHIADFHIEDKNVKASKNSLSIAEILDGKDIEDVATNINEIQEQAHYSILDFANFLMHVLKQSESRYGIDVPLNADELLTTFEHVIEDITPIEFIKDLLFYRIVFDRFIVKTVDDENEEDQLKWALLKPELYHYDKQDQDRLIFKNTFDKQDRIIKNLSMLQVTFRTRKYKNWVNDVLSWFNDENDLNISADEYLRKLDQLALDTYNKNEEFKNITVSPPYYSQGTKTPHYLFNFIDYLMWVDNNETSNFEFKYRNSVEHHLPQSYINDGNKDFIDNLGNLCLVSKSGNSKMNNESPIGKASENGKFYKKNIPPKQKAMYDLTNHSHNWGVNEIEEHYNTTLKLLENRKMILGL